MNLFKQRKTKLYSGQEVKEGNKITFTNSDGKKCEGLIERRKFDAKHVDNGKKLNKGTLFFWNIGFNVSDYQNATFV